MVRFDTRSRAQLVSEPFPSTSGASTLMPRKRRSTGGAKRSSGKPRVVKGKVNIRVAGYLGVQKLAPSKLIPYLPATKVRQAAKKALVASGNRPGKRVAKRRRGRKGKGRRRRRRRSTRTRRKRRTA